MWSAYQALKLYHRRPSDDLGDEAEPLYSIAAWCVDATVMWFGITVENLLNERVNNGTTKEAKWEAKYTLLQLLDISYKLPRPARPVRKSNAPPDLASHRQFLQMARQSRSNVKLFTYVGPPN